LTHAGINIPDNFSESFETVLGLKNVKFFYAVPGLESFLTGVRDLGSGMEKYDPE
jgi:hypothetical protein